MKQSELIKVTAVPKFIDDEIFAEAETYYWIYHIIIANNGTMPVQLISRSWQIIDSNGLVTKVQGAGVVGEQPFIKPGENYSYFSGTPLLTPWGLMMGKYEMLSSEGELFEVEIPAFSLDSPAAKIPFMH